ncbi:MAG: arginine--tRNA ligase [Thermotogota bacterium]
MKPITDIIHQELKSLISDLFGKELLEKLFIQETNNPKFGDYQTNFAMITAKDLKQSPKKTAKTIVENFKDSKVIKKIEIAGPGFINLFLKEEFIKTSLINLEKEKFEFDLDTKGKVIIDYSSPNIAKPMHIGHLRSTVIGDSVKRILNFVGYDTVGDNHLGDWGTQFGALIVGYRKFLNQENYKNNPIEELERIYVEYTKHAEDDAELKEQARTELAKLQQGEEENTKLWKEFIEVSMQEYDKIYKRMDIEFDTYNGESFYHDIMHEIIELLKDKNIAEKDEGALVVKFDDEENLHNAIVQKSNGSYLYTTSDLACIKYRREHYDVNKLVYVTDHRQQTHFKQVFKIADMLGWTEEKAHVYFGLMRFADGVFSTRKGNVIKLKDLLDKAKEKAREVLEERNSTGDLESKAEIIGIAAVKYADLSQNRTSDIIFDWDKVLSFNSNSSPYLQYTYARISSLLKKANKNNYEDILIIENEYEDKLVKNILKFPNAVLRSAEAYKPNLLTDYLYELAQSFNSFYNNVNVIKSEETLLKSRLNIAAKTAFIIGKGLDLLGIKTLEEM